jgi:AcrR family transcriptional regulator
MPDTEAAAGGPSRPYHHGSLKESLLAAAERILDRDGLQALTLRAAARAAGVSHAAPKNHFGDLTGLLSELAAVGFTRFAEAQRRAAATAATPRDRLVAIGRAYVDFAVAYPALFQLMFRGERLDYARPSLREATGAAGALLSETVGAREASPFDGQSPSLADAARIVAAWSLVHGFAMLLLDGRLAPILAPLPDGTDAGALLDEMLNRRG